MKKNKILYILIFVMGMFGFNCNVYAAKELSCLYEKDDSWNKHDKVLLIQYSDGSRKIMKNAKDVSLDEEGWYISSASASNFVDNITLSNGNLTDCPTYVGTETGGKVLFSNKDEKKVKLNGENYKLEWFGLETADEKVEEPKLTDITTPESTSGWLTTLDNDRYTGSCLYEFQLDDGQIHYVQIDFGKNNILFTEYDPAKEYNGTNYSGVKDFQETETSPGQKDDWEYSFENDSNFTITEFLDTFEGECASIIKVDRDTSGSYDNNGTQTIKSKKSIKTTLFYGSSSGTSYYLVDVRGINPLTEKNLVLLGETSIDFLEWEKIENCEDLLGEDLAGILNAIWNLIKIGVPIILIVLGVMDFAKATFSGNEEEMKKTQAKFIKRVIIAIAIFLIPTLLEVLLNLAHEIWPNNIGTDICGILG